MTGSSTEIFPFASPCGGTYSLIVNFPNLLALMGPIGGPELLVIFLVILLLFGAKKIPELARGIGKGMGEFKKAKEDFEDEIKLGESQGRDEWEKKTPPASSENDPHHQESATEEPAKTED